jgi:hypothetical protein
MEARCLPMGIQLATQHLGESVLLFEAGSEFQQVTDFHRRRPVL